MKHVITLLVVAVLPLVAFAQNMVTAEALKLVEGGQADVLYANEFGNFRNDERDEPFPYCVIRIDLEGDIEKAKSMLSLNVGSMFRVEAKDVFKDNMILFLISSSVRQVYLQCGDGCKPQQLHYGSLMANKVYACKVTFKAAEEKKAADNSDAILAQMAALQKQVEELKKQNQQNGGNNVSAKQNQEQVVQTPIKSNEDKVRIEVNGVTFNMIKVEGGTFQMGSNDGGSNEKPVHSVTLSDYYMGEMEVTQALWVAVMGNNPSYHKGDNLPVEQVSWNDCQEFIQKLNNLTEWKFSLPTEAQWEFAARGGNKSRGYMYSGSDNLDDVGWNWNNSGNRKTTGDWSDYSQISSINCQTHPVGTKQANELGIYDMSGNVWEWCQDWYGTYNSYSETNPTGPSSGSNRVGRGGSWSFYARNCRSTMRSFNSLDDRYYNLGLRLVLLP